MWTKDHCAQLLHRALQSFLAELSREHKALWAAAVPFTVLTHPRDGVSARRENIKCEQM